MHTPSAHKLPYGEPRLHLPEIALYGRSNVGKSSLVSALANHRGIARSSRTPGKTREINYYAIGDILYLVDLPGYGYARASKSIREHLWQSIDTYIQTPIPRRAHVLVLDAKAMLTESDISVLEMLHHTKQPVHVVVNKIDRLTQKQLHHGLQSVADIVGDTIPIHTTSAKNKTNIPRLRELLFNSVM